VEGVNGRLEVKPAVLTCNLPFTPSAEKALTQKDDTLLTDQEN